MCPKAAQSSFVLFPVPCENSAQCRVSSGADHVCCEARCIKGVPAPRSAPQQLPQASHQRMSMLLYHCIFVGTCRSVEPSREPLLPSSSFFLIKGPKTECNRVLPRWPTNYLRFRSTIEKKFHFNFRRYLHSSLEMSAISGVCCHERYYTNHSKITICIICNEGLATCIIRSVC